MLLIEVILYLYIFFIGTFLGSFYNVVGIRVPEKVTLMGRSHCPSCNHTLGPLELFPIIGYLILRGRCKNCQNHISVKYPIMEFITGLLFLISFVILRDYMVEYILMVVFMSLMIIITVSDLYYQIIPDKILLFFLPVILTLRIVSDKITIINALLGAVLGFLFMLFIAWYGKKRFKQEALGGGDIKLYFLVGLVLGIDLVFLSVLFAALIGLVYGLVMRKRSGYIPFVPFIFAGSLLAYFIGGYIITWYTSLLF